MTLNFIKASGNIITEDFCNSLAIETKADYVKDKSFGDSVKKIDEIIATSFEKLRERWEENRTSIINNSFDNSNLRQKWTIPFLKELGFDPIFIASNIKSASGIEYQIPYKGWDADFAPLIQMVNSSQDLDDKDRSSRTHSNKSPQDCLQQFLNTSDHQWAILTNGKKIRIVRDFYHSITKGFLEFDLEGIFETANSEQFRVLYRVLHKSRFENQYQGAIEQEFDEDGNLIERPDNCLLELFHKKAKETGIKVGNKLREQVINSIELLGNGFAEHLNPDDFQSVQVKAYYAEILNIIYRLLFLMFAEQKGWLPVRNSIYARTYSINSLKERAARGNFSHDDESDIWEGLKITFTLVTKGYKFKNGEKVNAFGGQLFSDRKLNTIINLNIKNKFILDAIYQLSFFKSENLINKINYANLAIDELGSVYESLLDYEPKLASESTTLGNKQINRGEFYLDDRGTDRKTSGSYYTDSRLVAQLIDSALIPVIENAIKSQNTQQDQEVALLDLKVADIACGSGAFLCAALEKMGEYLAIIRMGDEDRPTDEQLREAKRDVLLHCIYGVDLNPMALELAKFSLWITASLPDMPLSFLDHKLKFGNSLIGATPNLVRQGIPIEAYKEVGSDNKETSKWLREKVKKELASLAKGSFQSTLDLRVELENSEEEVQAYLELLSNEQETPEEVEAAENEYYIIKKQLQHGIDWRLADAWTASFFIEKTDLQKAYPTNETLYNLKNGIPVNEILLKEIEEISSRYHFFHFHLEFPDVFEKGGFDCLLGNPPWEKINFKDEEFFITRSPAIANARNKAERKLLMESLPKENPQLFEEYLNAKRWNDSLSIFFRDSGAYPLTGVSRVNLYSIFTEKYESLINSNGATGNVLPTGIILDNNNKELYFYLIQNNKIDTVIDYENRKGLFADVHRMFRFCLFVTVGKKGRNHYKFYQTEPSQFGEFVKITLEDIEAINPNTKTCPSFRNQKDYTLAQKIYKIWGVLQNESYPEKNKWDVRIRTPFNMSNDSGMFKPYGEELIPLYEAKYIYNYTHRYCTWNEDTTKSTIYNQLEDPNFTVKTQYYIDPKIVHSRFRNTNWCLVYRDITNATNERTMVASIIPNYSCGNTLSIIETIDLPHALSLLANLNSLTFDFFSRQTVGGTHFNHWILKQMPVIDYDKVSEVLNATIQEKVFRLIYTANDLRPMAVEYGNLDEPFKWSENERFKIQCDLDAIYAHLYGLDKEEISYILDTFPIIKRKDIDKFGSFRTKETILKMYDEYSWVKEEINNEKNN